MSDDCLTGWVGGCCQPVSGRWGSEISWDRFVQRYRRKRRVTAFRAAVWNRWFAVVDSLCGARLSGWFRLTRRVLTLESVTVDSWTIGRCNCWSTVVYNAGSRQWDVIMWAERRPMSPSSLNAIHHPVYSCSQQAVYPDRPLRDGSLQRRFPFEDTLLLSGHIHDLVTKLPNVFLRLPNYVFGRGLKFLTEFSRFPSNMWLSLVTMIYWETLEISWQKRKQRNTGKWFWATAATHNGGLG